MTPQRLCLATNPTLLHDLDVVPFVNVYIRDLGNSSKSSMYRCRPYDIRQQGAELEGVVNLAADEVANVSLCFSTRLVLTNRHSSVSSR